ncbi:MAG: glycosyltransferase [Candidatus Omnitrophota bacterium]
MEPFFSIIIPTYNRDSFIAKAVDSVLQQTFKNLELVIIDDGSTDNTANLINSYTDERIKYIYRQNYGPSSARNRGIKEARAEWVCFLDSDDWFDKEKLQITFDYIKRYPDYTIFHSEEIWYRSGKVLNQKKIHQKYGGWIFEKCLALCRVSISTACIHKSVFEKIGLLDESLPCCEDYDFWLRASLKYPLYLIPKALTSKEGGHNDQVSKKYWGMDRFRITALDKILKTQQLSQKQREITIEELEKKCGVLIAGCLKRMKTKETAYYSEIIAKYKNTK